MSTGVALTQAVIAVLTVVASLFGFILQRRVARSRTAEPKIATLEDRLEELGCTMRSAARLLNQVEAEIQARSASAERLKEEAQAAENLVKLNQAQRDAIAKLVRNEIGAETKKATRQSYIASALFFIAGVAATITITLLIHPLH